MPDRQRSVWLRTAVSFGVSLSFLAGCILFYFDALYVAGVTLFLIGSALMLVESVLTARERHGSSPAGPAGASKPTGSE